MLIMPTKMSMAAVSNSSSACRKICVAFVQSGCSCATFAILRLCVHASFHCPEKTGRQFSKSNTALPSKSGSRPHPSPGHTGLLGVGLQPRVQLPAISSRTASKSAVRLVSCGMPPFDDSMYDAFAVLLKAVRQFGMRLPPTAPERVWLPAVKRYASASVELSSTGPVILTEASSTIFQNCGKSAAGGTAGQPGEGGGSAAARA